MPNFQPVDIKTLDLNPWHAVADEWFLVTAEKDGVVNTMTASWGGLGYLWNKLVAFVFIRPQRFTKEFVDAADTMSLCFFGGGYMKEMSYLGTVSGRDENKIDKAGLHVTHHGETPYFEESTLALIGRKLYVQRLEAGCFLDTALNEKIYPTHDEHVVYVVEIEAGLVPAE